MTGVITSASSVSFQLSQNIHPTSPMIASVSLNMTVRTVVAAAVTWETSKVSLDSRVPDGWSS
ncbi:hypothetical protein D3C83_23100 [compost metagenome]